MGVLYWMTSLEVSKNDVVRAIDYMRNVPEFKLFSQYISQLKNADVLRLIKGEDINGVTKGRAQAYDRLEELIENASLDVERLEKKIGKTK